MTNLSSLRMSFARVAPFLLAALPLVLAACGKGSAGY